MKFLLVVALAVLPTVATAQSTGWVLWANFNYSNSSWSVLDAFQDMESCHSGALKRANYMAAAKEEEGWKSTVEKQNSNIYVKSSRKRDEKELADLARTLRLSFEMQKRLETKTDTVRLLCLPGGTNPSR